MLCGKLKYYKYKFYVALKVRLSIDTELFKRVDTACKEAADEAFKLWVKYYYISDPVMNYG